MKFHSRYFFILCLLFPFQRTRAQAELADDSITQLPSATVRAYLSNQPYLTVSSTIGLVDSSLLRLQQGTTLLPAMNTIPGVRMEERSPGSYRLSVRGSLLRSPFGVRNVKIYFDELPLTDAGGNTYLNVLDPLALQHLTILKGPDGSLFGANSGGVVLINPNGSENKSPNAASITADAGSYGLYHQQVSANYQVNPHYRFALNYAFQRSDGYRENTGLNRHYLQTVQRFNYSDKNELRLVGFYSDMSYETPGGLTEAQYLENPQQARPSAGNTPGSVAQHAAIYDKTLFGGLIHHTKLNAHFNHVLAVFGQYTDFANPFITNFEKRYEGNLGFRTYLNYVKEYNENFVWKANAGIEWQKGKADVLNYDNNGGIQGDQQVGDALKNYQYFYFIRLNGDIAKRLNIETALSLNYYRYAYENLFPNPSHGYQSVRFDPAWMPRFALSYLIHSTFSWRLSAGRGFSPATTAEVRSSDNVINTALRPETGWNYETGLRWQSKNNRFQADGAFFIYRMHDAIVRLTNEGGAESFTNAGGVNQRGIEATLSAWIIHAHQNGFIRGLRFSTNLTWSHFRFRDYENDGTNYDGNKVTGVPDQVLVNSLHFLFPQSWSLYLQHNYTSSIPLDDGNTTFADAYHLLQGKIQWGHSFFKGTMINFFGGADNILNQKYSLGNDINAFGGRFYNPAMPRNYYVGLAVRY